MKAKKNQSVAAPTLWGLYLFLPVLALASWVALGEHTELLGPSLPPVIADWPVLWKIKLGLYALAFFIPFISFPRVPNFRVFFLAATTAGAGVLETLWRHGALSNMSDWLTMGRSNMDTRALFVLMAINAMASILIPNLMARKMIFKWTLVLICGQVVLLILLSRTLLPWAFSNSWFTSNNLHAEGLGLGFALLVLCLSLWLSKKNYGIGGLASGLGLIAAMSFNHPLGPATNFMTSLLPAYLLAGVIYVWATRLRFRVSYDPLLMIYNRATCDQILSDGTHGSLGESFNIAMVDVDHFKKFNDRYGHSVGDEVLHQVAQTIRRESLPQGLCCRYGGEEIIVFLRRSDPGQGTKVFEKIRKSVQDMNMKSGRRRIRVTVSIGWVAVKSSTKESLSDYVKKADKALYRAKAGGRNKVVRDN